MLLQITRMHCMSIGGICAYVYFKKKEAFLRVIYRKPFQLALYVTTAFTFMASSFLVYLVHEIFACLFGLIILNIATNKNSMLKFETVIFNYLGKISYGLYMYQYFCIRLTFNYVSHASPFYNL